MEQEERIESESVLMKTSDGRDELNLVEFPLCALAHRLRPDQKTLQFEDRVWDEQRGETRTRQLTITGSDAYGLPTALDDEVLLGLIQLSKQHNFADRRVAFTRYRLLQLLSWRNETKSYERLEASLHRWTGVTLSYRPRTNIRVTSRHLDHWSGNRVDISNSKRPYGLTCSHVNGVNARRSVSVNLVTTADNYAGAVPQSSPINWNSITASSYTGLALKDSTGSTTGGVTLDLTSNKTVGSAGLTSGDKIFIDYFGGAGASSSFTLRGLTITKTYDILFYSDWYWKNGDSLPITQTAGTGLSGTFFLNRILSGSSGTVPPLTPDTNPANVTSGAGNIGNYCRIVGIVPDATGKVSFRIGDGANTAFSGFQLVQTGVVLPQADMLSLSLPSNPPSIRDAVFNGTNVTLTVPYGTAVTNLAPIYTLWPGATCPTASVTARNFTTPQTYTVTSSDSLVTKNYIAKVVIAPPLPEFTLTAPATWDGRTNITVHPNITNLALLQATGGTNFTYQWSVDGVAVPTQITPGVLTLTRSQGSGPLLVTLTMANGTEAVTNSTTIQVQEPATDPWVERTPVANEKPVNCQFFARNPFTNLGTIFYRGTQSGTPDTVYLKVYKTPSGGSETLETTHRQSLVGGDYSFTAPIAAGLITYRVVYGTTTGGVDTDVATVTNLVCGDAYIIEGQSNAVATDNSAPRDDTTNPWIRTYGTGWAYAQSKPTDPTWPWRIGFWGMKLATSIVTNHQMPVCIINGAVGGTTISQHQPNPANHTVGAGTYDIYANLFNRVIAAKLTHGIRGIFWHQGESDCSNFGPILDYDYTVSAAK